MSKKQRRDKRKRLKDIYQKQLKERQKKYRDMELLKHPVLRNIDWEIFR